MTEEIYNVMLDINLEEPDILSLIGFGQEEGQEIIDHITDMGTSMHREHHPKGEEPKDGECKGALYYLIKAIKVYLTSRPDMDDDKAMKILAMMMFHVGRATEQYQATDAGMIDEIMGGLLKKIMNGNGGVET